MELQVLDSAVHVSYGSLVTRIIAGLEVATTMLNLQSSRMLRPVGWYTKIISTLPRNVVKSFLVASCPVSLHLRNLAIYQSTRRNIPQF
jgi:hypothetical protein